MKDNKNYTYSSSMVHYATLTINGNTWKRYLKCLKNYETGAFVWVWGHFVNADFIVTTRPKNKPGWKNKKDAVKAARDRLIFSRIEYVKDRKGSRGGL